MKGLKNFSKAIVFKSNTTMLTSILQSLFQASFMSARQFPV